MSNHETMDFHDSFLDISNSQVVSDLYRSVLSVFEVVFKDFWNTSANFPVTFFDTSQTCFTGRSTTER